MGPAALIAAHVVNDRERREPANELGKARPLSGWCVGFPCLGDAALLAEDLGEVGELVLEGELFAGALPSVVDFWRLSRLP